MPYPSVTAQADNPVFDVSADNWNATVDRTNALVSDYVITKSGTTYTALPCFSGGTKYTSTGLVDAIQSAHDALTSGGIITIKRADYYTNKDWEKKLTITNENITLQGWGPTGSTNIYVGLLRAKDALNDDMIDVSGIKCTIRNLALHGNSVAQASGRGIYIHSGAAGDPRIENIYVHYTKSHCIDVSNTNYGFLFNSWVETPASGYGLAIQGASGNFTINGCNFFGGYGDTGGYYIVGTGHNLQNIVCRSASGFGIRLVTANYCKLDAMLYGVGKDAVSIEGSTYNDINVRALDFGTLTDNTYSGVLLKSSGAVHSVHNSVKAFCFSGNANNPKYCIYENDSNQNSNIYHNCHCLSAQTAQITLQGAQSLEDNNITA